MHTDRDLRRAVRWPLLVLAIAGIGIGVSAVLDRTTAREWALTIGGPALTVLLPVGLLWLVVAVISYVVKRRGGRPTSHSKPADRRQGPASSQVEDEQMADGDDHPGAWRS